MTDQRFLFQEQNLWAWNENRLTANLDKRITGNSKFHSETWLRNIGIPQIVSSGDLYNKGIVDPYNLEIREAYVQTIEDLEQIQTTDLNTVAKVQAAVKKQAEIIERLVKFIKNTMA